MTSCNVYTCRKPGTRRVETTYTDGRRVTVLAYLCPGHENALADRWSGRHLVSISGRDVRR